MFENNVIKSFKEGRPSFGIYVTTPSTRIVEFLGSSGLDFVRIDMDGAIINLESVQEMVHIAHSVGVTPFVRIPSGFEPERNEWYIQAVLSMGALGVIVPRVTTREDVEIAVKAAKPHPVGERHATAGDYSGGYGKVGYQEYINWVNENVLLAVQAETKNAIECIDEIASVKGLDMIHSGRGDLSFEYGVPGEQYHPLVLEAEKKVVNAGIKAGKIVTVQYYPLRDPKQYGIIREWIKSGVHCICLGADKDIVFVIRRLLKDLKG